ncbi:ABC transporter substrate-binding protein [Nesterenkonia lacusekhoensis]|uniref:Sn-glycerol 3-phosphate transport system substrate-binding protein n=1 Tax=Nesterenkonia lacusekhoensis TaxID=150832 RepID=A0ABS4SZ08_9MICC|nr:ABC transporter substrate-binding protein [Nesterenkonia lacusekhoensis]MBP2317433.1 sn-glycerol 3-phosphate transport system substrate-binding protein [Nesterenkonia lacusekhoensis]
MNEHTENAPIDSHRTHRSTRTLHGLSLAVVGGLALSACGGDGGEDGVTEIDFYYPIAVGGPLESVMDGYIEDFNAEHDDIEVTPVYSGDYEQTLASVQSAAQAGNSPAATVLLSTDVRSLEDSELITPIGEVVEDPEWFDSFDEGFMANSTLDDGTVASIPFQRSTIVMYWNKELFEEAGLDPETAPETWEEMAEAGQQVQDSTEASWGVQVPTSSWLFEAMAIQNEVLLDDETGTEVRFDDPGTVSALENWTRLQEDGVHPAGNVDWGTAPTDFANGDTAVLWHTTGSLTQIQENADFDFGVAPLPAQQQPGAPTGGGNLYIMEGISEEEQDAAVELTRYLSSPEIQADWTVQSGYVPPQQQAWDEQVLVDHSEELPQVQALQEASEEAYREYAPYRRSEIVATLDSALESALDGSSTPEQALSEAQDSSDDLLEEYR